MLGQQLAHLLQISHGNVPPLNDARFKHQPQIGRGQARSSAQRETILALEPKSRYLGNRLHETPALRRANHHMINHQRNLRCAL